MVNDDYLNFIGLSYFFDKLGYAFVPTKDYVEGKDGVSISSITQTSESINDGGENLVSVELSDGTVYSFTVKNGSKGAKGDEGIQGKQGVSITNIEQTTTSKLDGGTNVITITLSDGSEHVLTTKNGSKGSTGDSGKDGTCASWFSGTSVTGNSTTAVQFSVPGSKAGDMYLNTSTYNIYIACAADNWIYICNIKGAKGDKGDRGVSYGLCSTDSAVQEKSVICNGFKLTSGAEITVKFKETNMAANPTLNVNNTGAKPIYYRGSAIKAGYLLKNCTYCFVYNGEQWDYIGELRVEITKENITASLGYTPYTPKEVDNLVSTLETKMSEADQELYEQLTAYTQAKIADLINGAPTSMDTLKEVSDAIVAHKSVMDALDAAIGTKANAAEFDTHNKDATRHITASERDKWNNHFHTYASCTTAAGTAAKTVACTGYKLVTGAEITVKFSNTNTAANPTLNVNSTGAKPIYYRGAAISAGYLAANRTYTFRYNGTQYELVGDINTNTTYTAEKQLTLEGTQFRLKDYCSSVSDWNSATTNGFYMGNNVAHAPTNSGDGDWYMGFAFAHNGNYVYQYVLKFNGNTDISNNANAEYVRLKMNGTWGVWRKIAKAYNLPNSRVVTTTENGNLQGSNVTNTELGYLSGLRGNAQVQFDAVPIGNDGIMKKALVTPGLTVNGNETVSGTLQLTNTTDISGNAETNPALIIGAKTTGHLEFDPNEIHCKSNATTPGKLLINNDGGDVKIGSASSTVDISGSLILSKTTDLSGTADNKPALIVGGQTTGNHMEIDGNEIQAKSNGTTPSALHINPDGGDVWINSNVAAGTGKLYVSGVDVLNRISTHTTINSGSEGTQKWVKLATMTIKNTYQDVGFDGTILTSADAGTNSWFIKFNVRVKQQATLGNAPGISCNVFGIYGFTLSQIKFINTVRTTSQTVMELWLQVGSSHRIINLDVGAVYINTTSSLIFHDGFTPVANPTTGISSVNGTMVGTVNNSNQLGGTTASSYALKSDDLGGLKLKKMTQAQYNALATKDANTIYFTT